MQSKLLFDCIYFWIYSTTFTTAPHPCLRHDIRENTMNFILSIYNFVISEHPSNCLWHTKWRKEESKCYSSLAKSCCLMGQLFSLKVGITCAQMQCPALHCTLPHFIEYKLYTLARTALCCTLLTKLDCTALPYNVFHFTALNCTKKN